MTPIGAIKVSSDTGYVGMGIGWPLHSLRDSLQWKNQKLASKSSYVLMRYTPEEDHTDHSIVYALSWDIHSNFRLQHPFMHL